ncbi:helix-turn-helix transcriptional regulator [Allokutzneria sp. A3M-2-11 16]|uniref:helix-turn-helix transcriptional regulator n=1 Tax=Allokutzneria sp. A3M-2-11 16 TaxID=2962043 RepID=UPI0020B8FEA8|nr:helix-turn-helix transcriptional regulator [Allokutzneria sp. A3M-2-11 16]MCP3805294.1 helix-turn-helix transcriptional regulator [Allokutzneria sp. A3M-2-11 16]
MSPSTEQRRSELGAFLRMARRRVSPAAETASGRRRRTPGLRREEVSALARVSLTWYTWLEQGRDVRASEKVLASVSEALRLSPAERDYVFQLGRPAVAGAGAPSGVAAVAELEALGAGIGVPACVTDLRWNVLTSNAAADWLTGSGGTERNVMRLLFLNASVRSQMLNWREVSRGLVARFRSSYALCPHDGEFVELVAQLRASSEEFDHWWGECVVDGRSASVMRFRHSAVGRLDFHFNLLRSFGGDAYVLFYVPADARTRAVVESVASVR